MMNRMIFANLAHRPFRTVIGIIAVAVEVTLILLIVGIMLGMFNDQRNRQVGIGARWGGKVAITCPSPGLGGSAWTMTASGQVGLAGG